MLCEDMAIVVAVDMILCTGNFAVRMALNRFLGDRLQADATYRSSRRGEDMI